MRSLSVGCAPKDPLLTLAIKEVKLTHEVKLTPTSAVYQPILEWKP